jgi:hypothetical protein
MSMYVCITHMHYRQRLGEHVPVAGGKACFPSESHCHSGNQTEWGDAVSWDVSPCCFERRVHLCSCCRKLRGLYTFASSSKLWETVLLYHHCEDIHLFHFLDSLVQKLGTEPEPVMKQEESNKYNYFNNILRIKFTYVNLYHSVFEYLFIRYKGV